MITFNETEQKIIQIIKEHALSLNPTVTPRLVGGLIRDKILNINSYDIDITLDNISGYEFAKGLIEKYNNLHIEKDRNVHKIIANPNKSKHLETAVLSLYGLFVDFTNLRSETYTDSRIPIIVSGTPLEDSLRRDITINALFYNIISGEVEDFTGKGLDDIKNKRIRTPMPALSIFVDDPLRIIRIFRFKSKFDFDIDKEIYETLKDNSLGNKLISKVSKERIGIEIFKALKYERGYLCIFEIAKCQYSKYIFNYEDDNKVNKEDCAWFYVVWLRLINQIQEFGIITENILKKNELTYSFINLNDEIKELKNKIDNRNDKIITSKIHEDLLWLYIILHNYCSIKKSNKNNGNTKENEKLSKLEYINCLIIKENLKGSKSQYNSIKKIEENIEYLIKNKDKLEMIEMVLFCGEYLFDALIICVVIKNDIYFGELIKKIFDMNLYECYKTKPLVKGCDFSFIYKEEIKKTLQKCLVYQIKHPNADKKEIINFCINKVKE